MARDLFRKSFDEGTLIKLKIFEDYFKEWLPVFLKTTYWKEIQIFDLFAGEGKDSKSIEGSPIRIVNILNENSSLIEESKVKIKFIVNELEKDKYDLLVSNLKPYMDNPLYTIDCYNLEFKSVFIKYYDSMIETANFLFLDQNGIKQITTEVFLKLISLKQTDFLFFISSSYIKRFNELEDFRKYLNVTKQDLENKSYYHIHRIVLNYYRNLIPANKQYFLAPFSIKKPSGIYGLIFGSNHMYGIEKFLRVCWKHDNLTGDSNYDIDSENINLNQPSLFEQFNVPKKRQVFEESLRNKILSKELTNNIAVYIFTFNEGFLPKDANGVLKKLRDENKIIFDFKLASAKIHKEESLPIKSIQTKQ